MSEDWKKSVVGDAPNEIWTRTGQFMLILGAISAVGFKGFGFEIVSVSGLISLSIVALGLFCLEIGTRRKKILRMAEQRHERDLTEPNMRDREFLTWLKDRLPVTRKDLTENPYPHDLTRDHRDLAASSTIRRADFWVGKGEIARIGDTYDDPNKTTFGKVS